MPAVYTYEVTRTVTCRVSATSVEEAAEKSKIVVAAEVGQRTPGTDLTITELSIKRAS